MGLYAAYVVPWLTHLAMQNSRLERYRAEVVAAARGRVLEIGLGSGLNLPFYPRQITCLYGVEPSATLLQLAQKQAAQQPFPVKFLQQSSEALSLTDASVDTVVTTWTLCTIPDVAMALREMRRVLAPGGQLLFAEHGLSPEASVAAWQHRLTPFWKRCAGGCHLDRQIAHLIQSAGFTITTLQTTYVRGPRPWTYFYVGRAE